MKVWWQIRLEKDHKYKRYYNCIWILGCVCLAAVFLGIPKNVFAYDAVTEIKVTVGYWGDETVDKGSASLSELSSSCGLHKELYTWINDGSYPGTTEAEGIYISDLMDYFGVDIDSVYYFNFETSDSSTYLGSAYQWTLSQLFGTRYSMKNCFYDVVEDYNNSDPDDFVNNYEDHYTVANIFDSASGAFSKTAWNEREEVQPMLALRTYSTSWKNYEPASVLTFDGGDDSYLVSTGKPILLFGQTSRDSSTRNLMAEMVKGIHIWFEGYPNISVNEDSISGKVGSSKKLKVTVETPDEDLTEYVSSQITWSSSDESIASVDENGNVTINAEGDATITGTYNGKTCFRVGVSGSAKSSDSDTKEEEEEQSNTDESPVEEEQSEEESKDANATGGVHSGSGSGDGSGDDSGNGSGTGEGKQSGDEVGIAFADEADQTTDSDADATNSSLLKEGGGNNTQMYEITEGVTSLVKTETSPELFRKIMLIIIGLVLIGVISQSIYFKRQLYFNKKIKRS
ncbi:Ig-like domain (group 2) [Eubacterium oxidoreducens]|uniref:Ig-like domain (Group 2) n=2 Tax=Eubacterium oxidoreducens TaxID=1732 RepID=A0A1G6BGQ9_EUBOX|nr:Ig-like domain (group 2) [Eubacterium oxidoreducens]